MSLKGSVSPPRRETLASMAEEVFTEMRTKSADPFEDDMFIRRASSGRTAECIEGPGVGSFSCACVHEVLRGGMPNISRQS
jgi:hypothetical protein